MAEIRSDPNTSSGVWWLRADCLVFLIAAFHCSEAEAVSYQNAYAEQFDDPSREWKCLREVNAFPHPPPLPGANPAPARDPFPDNETIDTLLGTRFWPAVKRRRAWVKGNSGHYALIAPGWRIEFASSMIQFSVLPLVVAVREHGGLIDAGFAKLRELGRLPPAVLASLEQSLSKPPSPESSLAGAPLLQRRQTKKWVSAIYRAFPPGARTRDEFLADELMPRLDPRRPQVSRKTLRNILSSFDFGEEGSAKSPSSTKSRLLKKRRSRGPR